MWDVIAFIHARKEEWRSCIISVTILYDMIRRRGRGRGRSRGRGRGIRMYNIVYKKVSRNLYHDIIIREIGVDNICKVE